MTLSSIVVNFSSDVTMLDWTKFMWTCSRFLVAKGYAVFSPCALP